MGVTFSNSVDPRARKFKQPTFTGLETDATNLGVTGGNNITDNYNLVVNAKQNLGHYIIPTK